MVRCTCIANYKEGDTAFVRGQRYPFKHYNGKPHYVGVKMPNGIPVILPVEKFTTYFAE